MFSNCLVLVADGNEEMETVIPVDVLRRAEIPVTLAGVDSDKVVKCSRNVKLVPDAALKDIDYKSFGCLILPGGMHGAEKFASDQKVQQVLKYFFENNKFVCCICAAPISLLPLKLATGRSMTCHPSVSSRFPSYKYTANEKVVVDGNLITSQGPGTSFDFALRIVELCKGKDVVDGIKKAMVL